MENPFLSWLRSNSFAYDFVPAVLCIGHNDQTTRYLKDVICLSSPWKLAETISLRGLEQDSELISGTRR
jgi:hypothetical protein